MKNKFCNHWGTGALALAVLVAIAGCSKKPAAQASTPPPVDAAATAPAAPAAPMASTADAGKLFTDCDAALKTGAYDKAAQALLAAQAQKNLTEQQMLEARNRMVGLQRSLADGIARGDASAIAAANLIRQAHMH